MSEELIGALSQLKDLRVIARTSAFSFKGHDIDVRDIGRKLNVDAILEGSVRKSGNSVRINAQLVDAQNGYNLWRGKYDRELEDILAIQDEITVAIVDNLKPKLLSTEQARPSTLRTTNPEAYDLYLRGAYLSGKSTWQGLQRGFEFFEKAIEKDPGFALPYVELAAFHCNLPLFIPVRPKEVRPKAMELVLKALEIDDRLSNAHSLLGGIRVYYEWDWDNGEKEYRRAIELNPSLVFAHTGFAQLFNIMGRSEEAMESARRAVELDPLSPYANDSLAEVLLCAGEYERTIQQLQKSIEISPEHAYMRLTLGEAYMGQLKYEEALNEFQALKEHSLGPIIDINAEHLTGVTYALMGEMDKTKSVLMDLEERSREMYVPRFLIAHLYFTLGDHDKAYEWLDRAYEEREPWLCYLKVHPLLNIEGVRSDPRYIAMLKKIGLDK
jgi:serine/threonine-protein kinase